MRKFFFLTVVFSFYQGFLFAQNPPTQSNYSFLIVVDKSAEFPGGMNSLYDFISKNLIYPATAVRNLVEGKTFIEFIVDKAGYIIPNSVKVIKGLQVDCDNEAIRVIKSCKVQWEPALKDDKEVNQKFVLPVAFKLTPQTFEIAEPLHPIENSIRTIVIAKHYKSQDPEAWTVYRDSRLLDKSSRIPIGDSVEVIGWAAWAFFIKSKSVGGYVSWKALAPIPELDSLLKIVAAKSEFEEERQLQVAESFYERQKPDAFLSLTSNKKSLIVGECATLTLAFNVSRQNAVRLQFYNLGIQLNEVIGKDLTPDKCWILSGRIDDIIGEEKKIGSVDYSTYPVYKGSYCPMSAGTITIPATKLGIAKIKVNSMNVDTILKFSSKPITLNVNPLPPDPQESGTNKYRMVGKFSVTDSILSKKPSVGESITYQITVSAQGLTFPIEPPDIKLENVISELQNIVDRDTLIRDQLNSSKTFVYKLVFKKPGVYDFGGKAKFKYFDKTKYQFVTATTKNVVTVYGDPAMSLHTLNHLHFFRDNFIAIDVSQSMLIEDYLPFRLKSVVKGLDGFLGDREKCDIGLIVFGGQAKHFGVDKSDSCYSNTLINSIVVDPTIRSGTAIGDAIWMANISFAKTSNLKKLVIIGDGDNTAGTISPKNAAELTKSSNFKIYTIGIGKRGLVPFGRDSSGNPNMIDNTFSDKDFKTISSISNGKYYWAKDAEDLTRILKLIFQ